MSDVKVYEVQQRPIPAILQSLPEFKDLSDAELFNFGARLRYIEEITLKIDEWTSGEERDLRAFIDRIELDIYINQSAGLSQDSEQVSIWLVHSSWAVNISGKTMSEVLSGEVSAALDRAPPELKVPLLKWSEWLQRQNNGLKAALSGFYGASTVNAALGNLIAVDVILAHLTAAVVKLRLSCAIP